MHKNVVSFLLVRLAFHIENRNGNAKAPQSSFEIYRLHDVFLGPKDKSLKERGRASEVSGGEELSHVASDMVLDGYSVPEVIRRN